MVKKAYIIVICKFWLIKNKKTNTIIKTYLKKVTKIKKKVFIKLDKVEKNQVRKIEFKNKEISNNYVKLWSRNSNCIL